MDDGYCNDETNIPECNYDGGDCCGSCINTDYCTNCTCIGNIIGNGVPNTLVGDGFCNDETNNVHCYYDGLGKKAVFGTLKNTFLEFKPVF